MKNRLLIYFFILFVTGCVTKKATTVSEAENIESLEELQKYVAGNCRFKSFSIGKYNENESFEKYGLDTLQNKYIWYNNIDRKIILNTFLKEKYAVKYAKNQIDKIFSKKIGAMTLTVASKKIEEKLIADFEKHNIKSTPVFSINDELGYSSEIDISECDSQKVAAILVDYPEVKKVYK